MNKNYQEPNVELISLVPQEEITKDWVDGEMGTESNTLFD
jgi:hypothetical protein